MLERINFDVDVDHHQNCVECLKENGWWFSRSEDTQDAFDIDIDGEWFDFANHWNRLKLDEYMKDGGVYRYRRYSAFEYDAQDGSLTQLPHAPYEQSQTINHLNGGVKRHFEPLEKSFSEHLVLHKILSNIGAVCSDVANHTKWNIKLHPYRILARQGMSGEPAPEGLHQDGVDYIVSYLINRVNVVGGISTITDLEKDFIGDVEMNLPNDFVIGNDRETYHGVSSVKVEDLKKPFAYRDVLVIAFEKI